MSESKSDRLDGRRAAARGRGRGRGRRGGARGSGRVYSVRQSALRDNYMEPVNVVSSESEQEDWQGESR